MFGISAFSEVAFSSLIGAASGWIPITPSVNTWTLVSAGSETWSAISPSSDTWTEITAGTETWTDISPSTDIWLRQG
jgi:hypothetical protein